jgi:hypothetical protein
MQISDTSIINMILDRSVERLLAALETSLSALDEAGAFLVRQGSLQEDPTRGVSVLCNANDPQNPGAWEHTIAAIGEGLGLNENRKNAYELGDGSMWYYRFSTQMKMFWKSTHERGEAINMSHVVLSRACHALTQMLTPESVGPDSFDAYAIQPYVARSEVLQKGGPGQFISEARILWQVLVGVN